MVCRHIRKRAISVGLNKVEGQTIHKKIFPPFNDIKHIEELFIIILMILNL